MIEQEQIIIDLECRIDILEDNIRVLNNTAIEDLHIRIKKMEDRK